MNPPKSSDPANHARSEKPPAQRDSLVRRVVYGLSLLNFLAVVGIAILLCIISEQWWFSTALAYLPRAQFVLPSLVLVTAAVAMRRRLIWLNVFSALLVIGPIMGLRLPISSLTHSGTGESITVVSYNIQGASGSIEKMIAELAEVNPEVMVLQEATGPLHPILDYFDHFHFARTDEYLVLAQWPVSIKDVCRAEAFQRATTVLFEIDHPEGAFLVSNIHLTSARYGLAHLKPESPITMQGVERLDVHQKLRDLEALETRSCVADAGLETPLLVVGDFNMPTSSSLFQKYWGGFTSAFDAAGFGYGYTSPCNTGNLWPSNTPWLRIDHILLSRHWVAGSCWVGSRDGSDHRYIAANIRRR